MSMSFENLSLPHYVALAVCAASAVTDARSGRIYDAATVPAILLGLAWYTLAERSGLPGSVAGLALGLIPFGFAAARGWVGGGDVKLFGAVGALGGAAFLIDCVFVAFVLAAVYGLALVTRDHGAQSPGRLAAAVWSRLCSPAGDDGDDAPLNRPIRMGVFILAGAVAAALRVAGAHSA